MASLIRKSPKIGSVTAAKRGLAVWYAVTEMMRPLIFILCDMVASLVLLLIALFKDI
jgi:hypothetical protein